MPKDKAFYDAGELSVLLGISKGKAYMEIRELNNMLKEKGFRAPKAGLVSKNLVHEVFMLDGTENFHKKVALEEKEDGKVIPLEQRGKKVKLC